MHQLICQFTLYFGEHDDTQVQLHSLSQFTTYDQRNKCQYYFHMVTIRIQVQVFLQVIAERHHTIKY